MTEYGYMRVSAAVPNVRIADVDFNLSQIEDTVKKAYSEEVDVIVFPELSLSAYTCADLFEQPLLLEKVEDAVDELITLSLSYPILMAVGIPVMAFGKRFNCAVIIADGRLCGIVPKSYIPNYGEFYEKRWFDSGKDIKNATIKYTQREVPFGTDLLFEYKGAKIGVEICEDLWMPVPPSCSQALAGADIILNLSASDEIIGKHNYLLKLIAQQSARCRNAYVYASAGWGESSTDLVFSGNAIIAEDGSIRRESPRFQTDPSFEICDVDIEKLRSDRAKYSTFYDAAIIPSDFRTISCDNTYDKQILKETKKPLTDDRLGREPFVPDDIDVRNYHCEEIINIQSQGLMQRLNAIKCTKAVIGISGGLDSTLALLVTVKAFDRLNLDRKGIIGITMPGLATTSRTHSNAVMLMEELGVTSLEIPIGKAVAQHFSDIEQDPHKYDVTYENSQARERTQILMDYANKENAIVIGTGDMSELALGWCTYNGDHMSMYGVNASVPKTLVKHLVKWFSHEIGGKAEKTLLDIFDTPISPELVPSDKKDEIGQKTEDLVGPYELHDFFLYHLLRNSFSPKKIYWLAKRAFEGVYDDATLLKWLRNFYRRFFNQQFKRSCMPDGPKVGSVCLSPRGDWRMPSDASSALWLKEVDSLS